MIKEAYCSFEVAKLLKEKGFVEPCLYYYFSNGKIEKAIGLKDKNTACVSTFSTPTHQMAMKWLREVRNIAIEPMLLSKGWFCQIERILDNFCKEYIAETNNYNKYEEAVESALKYCLENLI